MFAAALMVTVVVLTGCGSSSVASSDTSSTVATVKPQPAGPNPSKSARMVCSPEANGEIAQAPTARSRCR